MINTKLYKSIYKLAEELLEADRKGDQEAFDTYYAELQALCHDNENTDKDYPEQWETLADFTADYDEALSRYEKALSKAVAADAKDHLSSIGYSMAVIQIELGQTDAAVSSLQAAQISANKIEDKVLKNEIHDLLTQLLADDRQAAQMLDHTSMSTKP